MDGIQFGHALNLILCEIILTDLSLGPVKLMEVEFSDGFYHVNLKIDGTPKLGEVFPTKPGQESITMFPLVLPIG